MAYVVPVIIALLVSFLAMVIVQILAQRGIDVVGMVARPFYGADLASTGGTPGAMDAGAAMA